MTTTLFERLGGEAAIMAAVDLFHHKLLTDPLTRPFFDNVNMDVQATKQIAFIAWALGGPEAYKGRDLRTAHRGAVAQGLSDQHFDVTVGHLAATLRELGVAEDLVQEALTTLGTTRNAVLNR